VISQRLAGNVNESESGSRRELKAKKAHSHALMTFISFDSQLAASGLCRPESPQHCAIADAGSARRSKRGIAPFVDSRQSARPVLALNAATESALDCRTPPTVVRSKLREGSKSAAKIVRLFPAQSSPDPSDRLSGPSRQGKQMAASGEKSALLVIPERISAAAMRPMR
jgi:hypothetical protein